MARLCTSFLFIGLLSFVYFSDPVIDQLSSKLSEWNATFPAEKIFVHTDRPYYALGDTIWYKMYLVNANTLLPDTLSKIAYVELIDPTDSIIARRNQLLYLGGSPGDIVIENSFKTGKYQLRAYSRFMGNAENRMLFSKEIEIVDGKYVEEATKNDSDEDMYTRLDVQFLPESGNLINGLSTKIGLKAIDKKTGLGLEITGRIEDENGKLIVNFKTFENGLASFPFTPNADTKYKAEITFLDQTKIFEFPKVEYEGSILTVISRKDYLTIAAKTSKTNGLDNAYITIMQKGVIVGYNKIESKKSAFTIKTLKENLVEGVAVITLFSDALLPLAERLVFIEKDHPGFSPIIKANANSYSLRQKVMLEIDIADESINTGGAQSNLSIAITDNAVIQKSESAENIKSYLLLTSDLNGTIENPGYYFIDDSPKRMQLLDILMMTQGWRRFTWDKVLQNKPLRVKHPMEKGFTIEGYVSKYERPSVPAEAFVTLSAIGNELTYQEDEAWKDGKFTFYNVAMFDTTAYFIQARLPNSKSEKRNDPMEGKKWNSIHIDDPYQPKIVRPEVFYSPFQDNKSMIDFITASKKQQTIANNVHMSFELDEVTISRRKIEKEDESLRRGYELYSSPSDRIILDSISNAYSYNSVFQLLRARVAGVQIRGMFPNEIAVIRGAASLQGSVEALYLLDGFPMDAATISSISVSSISHIDVLKGAKASIYGIRGAGGVIAVHTKNGQIGSDPILNPGIENYIHPGPYWAREFYSPQHDGEVENQGIGIDIRNTLYWEPFLVTDSTGKATIEFYTCDVKSDYQVDVQGITFDGRPVVIESSFTVR